MYEYEPIEWPRDEANLFGLLAPSIYGTRVQGQRHHYPEPMNGP
jgi:hypothetical protein